MSLEEMRLHLQRVRDPDFDSRTYTTTGYALRGSIRTDGFRLQALAFKLSELSAVKYKRLPQERMPRRITSTLGGLDDYFTEIRNVIKTPQDVADIFDCPPEQVKIVGIDMGQACVIGASAILPSKKPTKKSRKPVFFQTRRKTEGCITTILQASVLVAETESNNGVGGRRDSTGHRVQTTSPAGSRSIRERIPREARPGSRAIGPIL